LRLCVFTGERPFFIGLIGRYGTNGDWQGFNMNIWKDTYPLIVSCARGLAPLTAAELMRLGY